MQLIRFALCSSCRVNRPAEQLGQCICGAAICGLEGCTGDHACGHEVKHAVKPSGLFLVPRAEA